MKNINGYLLANIDNQTIEKYRLPFRDHEQFVKADLEERSILYCQLAALIWSPDQLLCEEAE